MKKALVLNLWLLVAVGDAVIDGETRTCSVRALVPFTFHGVSTTPISVGNKPIGFSYMAAAFMAMEHFNDRNPAVVPELADPKLKNCSVAFATEGALFFDTASEGHQGSSLLFQDYQGTGRNLPCAFVGPYDDTAAAHIAVMAASTGIPHIPFGGVDARLGEEIANPQTMVIYPRISDICTCLAAFLIQHQRTNFIAILFAFTDVGNQFQEGLGISMDALNITNRRSFGYLSPTTPLALEQTGIGDAVRRIAESGYRTIVVTMDNPPYDLAAIADAAEAQGINTDDYVWIFLPPFQPHALAALIDFPKSIADLVDPPLPDFGNVSQLLKGAALINPMDGFQADNEKDRFAQAWRSIDESFVERLNTQAQVVTPGKYWPAGQYSRATTEYFQTTEPEPGTSYMYDAMMTIGLGACIAEQAHREAGMTNETISSEEQLLGMRAVNFTGSSGHVEFGVLQGFLGNVTGSRHPRFMHVGVFNLFPPSNDEGSDGNVQTFAFTARYSDILTRADYTKITSKENFFDFITIDEYRPFLFSDGSTTAPALLRDPPNQNYLSPGLRVVGLCMGGFALLCCLFCLIWVVVHRNRRIVTASQPLFLFILICGATMSSLAIFGITGDESAGFTAEQLSRHCMAIIWLSCCGHILTYGALFTKLWRVNKVLQFSRRQIKSSHVVWPSVLLLVAALTILTIFQCLDPLRWTRVELDPFTGESIGWCDSETMRYYIISLAIVMTIPSILTCVMAYKCRDVDNTYSESSWIFNLVVIQLQIIIVAIPLVIVLRDVSTDGKFIGHLLMLWSMPMSTIAFIMVPKIVAQYKSSRGMSQSTRVRGATQGVRVSGIPGSASMAEQQQRLSNSLGNHHRTSSASTGDGARSNMTWQHEDFADG